MADVQAQLNQAKVAYVDGRYGDVAVLLEPWIEPRGDKAPAIEELPVELQVELYQLLGLAFVLSDVPEPERAKAMFWALLALQPSFTLVDGLHPQEAVELFARTREEYQARLGNPTGPGEGPETGFKAIYIEREVTVHQPWLVAVPFGIGQYQNGDTFKFYLFLGAELLTLGINVGCFTWVESLRGADGLYAEEDRQLAENLQIAQFVAFYAFLGLVVGGVADAWLNFEPTSVRIRTLDGPPPELRSEVDPLRPTPLLPERRRRVRRAQATSKTSLVPRLRVLPPPQTPRALMERVAPPVPGSPVGGCVGDCERLETSGIVMHLSWPLGF